MNSTVNRRKFLIQSATAISGLVGLSSCTTLDDYLFEDRYDLKDQTLIIGGGLSGLAAGYYLKKRQSEYLVVEAATSFGGRIKSVQSYDLGGSIFKKSSARLSSLAKELKLPTIEVDREHMAFVGGAQTLVDTLVTRLGSLMPYRQTRLRWKLEQIKTHRRGYECVFIHPKGRKTLLAENVILAVPPNQWSSIQGLFELEVMQPYLEWSNSLKVENVIRINFPVARDHRPQKRGVMTFQEDKFVLRQVFRQSKNLNWYEFDLAKSSEQVAFEIQKMNDIVRRRSGGGHFKMGPENFFDWSSAHLIEGAYFLNSVSFPQLESSKFQIIGDFAAQTFPHSMEGALETAQRAVDLLS